MPNFKTDRLIFRQFEKKDLESLTKLMTDAPSMKFTGFKKPQSKERIQELLNKWNLEGSGKLGVWAVECNQSGDFIGWSMLKKTNSEVVELGYMISSDQRGKGYATEIASALLNYACSDLKLPRVRAITSPENIPSVKILEKIGMKKIDGSMTDEGGIFYEYCRGGEFD